MQNSGTSDFKTTLKTTFRATLLAAASTAVLATVTFANPVDTFYADKNYTYCDLKLLAKFWGEDTYKAKITAGTMMEQGQGQNIPPKLATARTMGGVECTFADADNPDYTYDDAVALAKYWGMKQPGDAKTKVAEALFNGNNVHVIRSLRAARGGTY